MAKAIIRDTDPHFRKLFKRLDGLEDNDITVGIHKEKAAAPKGSSTLREVALVHELGSPARGIPPRSFVASWLSTQAAEISRQLEKADAQVIRGEATAKKALLRAAQLFAGSMQQRIYRREITPPLSASTIASKGSDIPLLDTGQLAQSIEGRVAEPDA